MSAPQYQLEQRTLLGKRDKRRWGHRLTFVCAVVAVLGLLTPNPYLTAAGLMVLPLLFVLLWQPGEPPVLFFAATFQWLQVYLPIVNANRDGHELGADLWLPEMQTAAWLGFIAISLLALGMRIGLGRRIYSSILSLDKSSVSLRPERLMWLYGLTFAVAFAANQAAEIIPGLRQQFQAIGTLRWVVVFLIGWAALRSPRFRVLALTVFFIELVLGFTGYFSTFKTILFLGIILILGSNVKVSKLIRPSTIAAVLFTVLLTTFWQAIKEDYRYFLSQGRATQAVTVPVSDRFLFLFDQVTKVTFNDLVEGFDSGLERLGYLEFLGRSIDRVPQHIPHQEGRLTKEAIMHVFMPRVLFPGKPSINDSDRTSRFTGIRVAGVAQGTSISMGYAAESYIDFGPVMMFAPIVLLGLFWGWAYQWLIKQTPYRLLGLAIATNIILGHALFFESSNIKILGGALTSLLVLWLILKLIGNSVWGFMAPYESREKLSPRQ